MTGAGTTSPNASIEGCDVRGRQVEHRTERPAERIVRRDHEHEVGLCLSCQAGDVVGGVAGVGIALLVTGGGVLVLTQTRQPRPA